MAVTQLYRAGKAKPFTAKHDTQQKWKKSYNYKLPTGEWKMYKNLKFLFS